MLHTTLILLRKHHACGQDRPDGSYNKLRASLPVNFADDTPITLAHILESNGIEDALWALRATVEPTGRNVAQEIAIRSAERSLPIFEKRRPNDSRVRECVSATRAYLRGEISRDEFIAKRKDAAYAASDAAYAASDAAYAAYAAAAAADAAADDDAAYAACAAAAAADVAADAARRIERDAQARDLRELLGVSP